MTWEAVAAVAALFAVLLQIAKELRTLNRSHIEKAQAETKEKLVMENRVTNLETSLADHTKHLWQAIDSLRVEMPRAIAKAIVETRETANR